MSINNIDAPSREIEHEHDHPGSDLYLRVAIVLTIVTAIEVVVYSGEAIRTFLVPLLIVLSVGKFIAVVGYFMHLKFDDNRFAWMFGAGLAISLAVFIAAVAMQWTGGYFIGDVPSAIE
ncbi:MAG TPA: cytochrome C oxidase subunit IV family protein, partial [Thermomicrobiales bacterium]|nr:cytochrome C oxidase subunit IV family protein [Thermomicrobiales bacterium]